MARWQFEVTDNGQWVAGGDCTDRETALREAGHYTMMYGQDGGDVKALVWTGRKPSGSRSHAIKPAKSFVERWSDVIAKIPSRA